MTEVIFLTSVQDHEAHRVSTISEKLKARLPDVDVTVLDGRAHRDLMTKHKIQFGPAVIIDGRLEYVGIPRLSMLLDRVLQVRDRRLNPRTAGDKPAAPPPANAPPATTSAQKPAVPAAGKPTDSG